MLELLTPLLPEVYLFVLILVSFSLGIFSSEKNQYKNTSTISIVGLICIAGLYALDFKNMGMNSFQIAFSANNTLDKAFFISYPVILIAKFLIACCSAIILISAKEYLKTKQMQKFEFNILLLLAVLGANIALSSFNLIILFIGLELFSFSVYILIAFLRSKKEAVVSSSKYFIVGGVASSLMLYGISLLYTTTGSVSFNAFNIAFTTLGFSADSIIYVISFIFILVSLLYKVAIVPMQFYLPDVAAGANRPVLAFISTVSKIAGFVILLQFLTIAIPFNNLDTSLIYYVMMGLALSSMFIGSLFAIREDNINRFLAYSSINNAGFMLMLVILFDAQGLLYYLTSYSLVIIAFICALLSYKVKGEYVTTLSELFMISKKDAKFGFILVILLFALAGIPPFMLFYAKFMVFKALIAQGFIFISIVTILLSVVATSYCLKAIKMVYFTKSDDELLLQENKINKAIVYLLFGVLLILSLIPSIVL